MNKFYLIVIFFLFISCNSVRTISSIKANNYKVKIKSIATSCCGFCGERIVLTSRIGETYILQFGCNFVYHCCSSCGYSNRKWYSNTDISEGISYLPIYDTAGLLKRYPNLKTKNNFTTGGLIDNIDYNQVFPLSSEDSILIHTAIFSDSSHHCKDIEYLQFIKGFVREKVLTRMPS
jgi:hypothetical protein